jgi:hypothetical protein
VTPNTASDEYWAGWVTKLDQSPNIQAVLANEIAMADIRKYADSLRSRFPEIPDRDIGRLVVWMADFIMGAKELYGSVGTTPDMLALTFGMVARDLFSLLAEAPTDEQPPEPQG